MAVDGISGTGTSATSSALGNSRQTIAENFDTFLQILTTQLQNQNPMEPLDTNQFTQQLVQFTSVEQQLQTNEYLKALVTGSQTEESQAAAAANQAVNLIGKTVTAGSSAAELEDGKASWTYTLGKDAPDSQITIRNSAGQTVYSETASLSKGQSTYEWDGRDKSGLQLDDGTYSLTIDARDANGNAVSALTQTRGVVDSVDLTGDEPILMVNGSRIYLDSVLSVSGAGSDESTES